MIDGHIPSLHHNYLLLIAAVLGFGFGGPRGVPVLPRGHGAAVLQQFFKDVPLVLEILEETAEISPLVTSNNSVPTHPTTQWLSV